MIDSTNKELEEIEGDLNSRPNTDAENILAAAQRVDRSENDLRVSLKRTRTSKLKKLQRTGPPQATPTGKPNTSSTRRGP